MTLKKNLSEIDKLHIVVDIFDQLFKKSENTELQLGATEPFYQAATHNSPAIIFTRQDYLSSALHEIAHWCIAGKKRRKQDDFGYWYKPEGRSVFEQTEFEAVEVKPQAIEWVLSLAINHFFHFSADNITQSIDASDNFKMRVRQQLNTYFKDDSLPARAKLLFENLNAEFRGNKKVDWINV